MASTYGKEASSPLVVHLYGPSRVKVSSPATKKAIAANGTAVAVLSSTAAVDKPLPRKKVTSLWVPQELTDKDLPHVLGKCPNDEAWQKLLDKDDEAYGRFMDYDADHKLIIITHLPSYGHHKTSEAFAALMARATIGFVRGQRIGSAGTVTTLARCEGDKMFIPKSLPDPTPGGAGPIYAMDKDNRSYGTLVLETRHTQRVMPSLRKIDRWFGVPANSPQTSVQLVLVIAVWGFVPVGGRSAANPTQWRLEATLYSHTSWVAGGAPLVGTPIEFGDLDLRQQPLANPCTARGTHILHIPADLLYANVPQAGVPPALQATPANPNPTLDIDLFDLQDELREN